MCYRKGGDLAVTDANAVTGRVVKERFPKIFGPEENLPLDDEGSRSAFLGMISAEGGDIGGMELPESVAYGFIKIGERQTRSGYFWEPKIAHSRTFVQDAPPPRPLQ